MARYSVDVVTKVDFSELSKAEQSLKNLQNMAKNGINIKVNTSGLNNLNNAINNIGKNLSQQFANVGKQFDDQMKKQFGNRKYSSPTVKGLSKSFLEEEKAMRTMANRFYSSNKKEVEALKNLGYDKTAMKAMRVEVNNAKAILNEQLSLVEKIQRAKADYIKHSNNGDMAQALVSKSELEHMRKQMNELRKISQQFEEVYKTLNIDVKKELKNKSASSSGIVDKARASVHDKAQKEIQRQTKAKAESENKQAKAILNEQVNLIEQIQRKRAEKLKHKNNGNFSQALATQEEINHLRSRAKDLKQASKEFSEAYKRLNIDVNKELKNKALNGSGIMSGTKASIHDKTQKEIQRQTRLEEAKTASVFKALKSYKFDARVSDMTTKLSGFSPNSEGFSKASKAVSDYSTAVSNLKRHFDKNDAFTLSAEQFDKNIKTMTESSQKFTNAMKIVRNEGKKTLSALDSSILGNNIQKFKKDNTKLTKDYIDALDILERKARSGMDVSKDFAHIKSSAGANGLLGKSSLSDFKRAFGQIFKFAAAYGVIQRALYQIPKEIFQAVADVDKAQIELTKVTDASQTQLTNYWEEATASAKKYGSTISDVIKSTADWSRLGYSLDEAKKLSDATTLLTKVGDNMTQETSSSGMISTLKGFELSADKAQDIVDKVNEVNISCLHIQ